nr:cation/H(+) antiporter 15-like [Ziziphus jujuba var. spinosa]
MRRRTGEGKPIKETHVVAMFILVLVAGFLGELIGQHSVFGPLILGLVVPPGPPFGAGLMSKLDSLASGLFYSTYLAISGLQTNIYKVHFWGLIAVGIITLFACLIKIGAVMVIGHYSNIPRHEAFVRGLIMNGRGIIELMVFNMWRQNKVLKDQGFSLLVISVIVVTGIITPLTNFFYNPSSQYFMVKRNTIQHSKLESELKILVCIQNQEAVPTIINLLEVSHASEKRPLAVIGLILVELAGRTAPILITHQLDVHVPHNTTETSMQILNALRQYQQRCGRSTVVQSFTCVSHFKWMQEDICRVAMEKRANIVILPFHKQWAIDGTVGSLDRAIINMNINVIKKAPCSVAILIDRGILTGTGTVLAIQYIYHVAVIFIGGEDDAESLAYGARMAKHEIVDLTVARFIHFGDTNSKERRRDSELIDEYRQANAGNERFVIVEEMVKDAEGLSTGIRAMADCLDLILVGRSHPESPLLEGMGRWSDCPELGVIGDMLALPEFGMAASVLVVQQQRIGGNNAVNREFNKDQLIHDAPFDDEGKTSWTITMDKNDKK